MNEFNKIVKEYLHMLNENAELSQKDKNLIDAGFETEVNRKNVGKCPFCGKEVDPDAEFAEDPLGKKEFDISGICKKCQDSVFGEGAEAGKRIARISSYPLMLMDGSEEEMEEFAKKLKRKGFTNVFYSEDDAGWWLDVDGELESLVKYMLDSHFTVFDAEADAENDEIDYDGKTDDGFFVGESLVVKDMTADEFTAFVDKIAEEYPRFKDGVLAGASKKLYIK